jgi:YVTN family beta-propeller protein
MIDGIENKVIANISVGDSPGAIGINPQTNMIYVANYMSNTVSVIDGSVNDVVAGIRFNVNSVDRGHIICDGKDISTNDIIYFCIALSW